MRIVQWMALLVTAALSASATTITDAYAGQLSLARNNGDVIGFAARFDIEKLTIESNGGNVTINIDFNWNNGDATLSPIADPGLPVLNPGDVLITNGTKKWAIPLINHSGFSGGDLYLVQAFLNAATVLGNPNYNYRPTENVWGSSAGAVHKGVGTVSTSNIGGYQVRSLIQFSTTDSEFLTALNDTSSLIHFAAATCANDIIDGSPTPEPLTSFLIGSGLVGIGLVRWRSKA